jgi:hypothetical protein
VLTPAESTVVAASQVEDEDLRRWVGWGLAHADSLPPK